MPRLPKKKSARASNIRRIPNEVLIDEVFGRVAASSSAALINLKLSCKKFNSMAEDKHVYRRLSLDEFPIVPWKPSTEKQQNLFLSKCRQYENPEAIYRQAVLDYFNKSNIRSACMHLDKAVRLGHVGAFYLTCIVLLVCGDPESKEIGVKLLSSFISKYPKEKLSSCRDNLMKKLGHMWVKNPSLRGRLAKCCSNPNEHPWRKSWCPDDEINDCRACCADREIKFVSSTYNYI